jgi:hypothetical protein
MTQIVSLDSSDGGGADLRGRIAHLERRLAKLTAVPRLVLAVLRLSGFKVEFSRVPEATDKRRLLAAVERARRSMPMSAALRVLGLSSARYHAWVQVQGRCALDGRPSCPRSVPQRLTHVEVEAVGDMVQSVERRPMSIRGLALHAQRVRKVFAHPVPSGKSCGRFTPPHDGRSSGVLPDATGTGLLRAATCRGLEMVSAGSAGRRCPGGSARCDSGQRIR